MRKTKTNGQGRKKPAYNKTCQLGLLWYADRIMPANSKLHIVKQLYPILSENVASIINEIITKTNKYVRI